MKQKRDRYEMHKYWGKKPSGDLRALIEKYSQEGDTLLDPFSGYGVFCCEAFLLNRNVIANDLNPIAHFLNLQLVEEEIDVQSLQKQWRKIKAEFEPFVNQWYAWKHCGQEIQLSSVLRDKHDIPIKARFRLAGQNSSKEVVLDKSLVEAFLEYEKSQEVTDWYPEVALIPNSRISAKPGMSIKDLFTKRTLACHARLHALIQKHSSGNEKNLLLVAFSANLANCSKLVPPIGSRGEMAPGAWMTGFYIAETYIENNVLHYFENRFDKVLRGKLEFLNFLGSTGSLDLFSTNRDNTFCALLGDAKNLDIETESIDYIFTDPPYGDAVPYFEQSIIWNSWLGFIPDYENEIVITDSKVRTKNTKAFEDEIKIAFSEIRRVLKNGKHFSLTYHSLSGLEWKAITNACILNGFELVDYEWLIQKSFTPRQINRAKSIKGDVLVTLRKSEAPNNIDNKPDDEIARLILEKVRTWLAVTDLDTNEIFLRMMKIIFAEKILIGNIDLLGILLSNFRFSEGNKWTTHDTVELLAAR
jgi:DNA modification methylase